MLYQFHQTEQINTIKYPVNILILNNWLVILFKYSQIYGM